MKKKASGAMMTTASEGRTLSDACRELAEQLAAAQKKKMLQDAWLSEQVTAAFSKLESRQASFISSQAANQRMSEHKARIRH